MSRVENAGVTDSPCPFCGAEMDAFPKHRNECPEL